MIAHDWTNSLPAFLHTSASVTSQTCSLLPARDCSSTASSCAKNPLPCVALLYWCNLAQRLWTSILSTGIRWFVPCVCVWGGCHLWFFQLTVHQRRQSGLKSGGRGSGSTKFILFQANFQEISIFSGNFPQKSSIFSDKFSKYFDFFKQFLKKIWFSRQKLLIYSYFWANYSISLQKSPLSNILPVHDKV